MQTGHTSAMNQAQRDTASTGKPTATTAGQTTPTSSTVRKEVHRRKKSAVVRLDERQPILNDPMDSAVVSMPVPGQGRKRSSVKGKISSAGRKLVSTILGQSSHRSNCTNDTQLLP